MKKNKEHLIRYLTSLKHAKKQFKKGNITELELSNYDVQLMRKYCIKPKNIYRTNYLIKKKTRANIDTQKGDD